MRMVAARLHGFRRFEAETTLDLTPRVVAIVGPNEAGKSSLLDGLEQLTTRGTIEFDARDFSGWEVPDDDKVILSALFEPDADDRLALASVPGGSKVRLWQRWREADGSAYGKVIPRLKRDRTARDRLARDLQRTLVRKSKPLQEFLARPVDEVTGADTDGHQDAEESPPARTVSQLATSTLDDLNSSVETMSATTCQQLDQLTEALEYLPSGSPAYMRELPSACREISSEHRGPTPNDQAFSILDERCPQVRVMRDADRQLRTGYRFEEHEVPPAPLANLLALAEIEWDALKEAAATPENPQLENLLLRANRRLEERLRGSWRQSTVSVRLSEQGGQLNVYPYDADSDTHSKIEERSDGFKSFLALLAFTTAHAAGERKLVLAIDEAERHLHYDAQVDLVGVLTRQTFATQIVYTTHSAGCLPEDLGSGIRVVKQCPGDRSQIENAFWSAQENDERPVAFTSLLMAMGADAVAFTPARHAVITEGPSDALLLPALLREALGKAPDHPLELQIAGGLAWTPPRLLPRLEDEGAHVIYLTDSDGPGEKYFDALRSAGVEEKRIFRLTAGSLSGLSIEDFVDEVAYVEVVNLLLAEERNYNGKPFTKADIPSTGAAKATETWATKRGIKPLSKTSVAEHLLRICGASLAYMYWDPQNEPERRPLLRSERRKSLITLLQRMRKALNLPEDSK
jgi:AAA domain, putative AbiEii toxin, Type IV TA system/AAA domain